MTPLGVKICGESEFDIFEAKKRPRQERDGTIVQTTHERNDQEQNDNYVCNFLHLPVDSSRYCVYRKNASLIQGRRIVY